MLAGERRTQILEMLKEEGSVRTTALSRIFNVSEVTIRQDLEKLAANGLISRAHGGAFLATVPDQVRSMALVHSEHMDRKAAIGRAAASLVKPGNRIILDSGSTTTEIARALQARPLTVITNALNIALLLGTNPDIEVMVTGGDFKAPTLSLTGEKAAGFFGDVHVDQLFLATAGVDIDTGLSYPGFADLPVKRAMVQAAGEVILVADSSKIGKRSLAVLGGLDLVSCLVTDSGISDESRRRLEQRGIRVIAAA
jgi:DeoR/GlpR family transcriptional regulator of sugar metabolism